MNRFYSSLIINSNKFPKVHQVFRPRFNKEFFKRLTANVEQLEKYIDRRVTNLDCDYDIKNLKEDSKRLIKLKDSLEKANVFDGNEVDSKYIETKSQLEQLEDKIMPMVVKIPNRFSKQVPQNGEVIIDECGSDFLDKQNLIKVLNHRKLSFINNCYSKSVVGPNSHYYFGIGAKLQHGLADYFANELESNKFIHTSGLCLTKSAVVESNNSADYKTFTNDPSRILTNEPNYTTIHLVETSRECLIGFLTTIGPRSSNEPLRLMALGAGYKIGDDWFDADNKSISQFQTLHTISVAPSIENYSMKEYHWNRDLIWNFYKKLELPIRLVQCSLDTMYSNEYDASRVDVWLPSRRQWLQVARISHYLDFITVRTGMKRGHIIDSSVYDGQVLVAAIIENKQTNNGRFIIPKILEKNLVYLTNEERNNYLNSDKETSKKETIHNNMNINNSNQMNFCIASNLKLLNNYEQRRYLVKKSYVLGHSKKAERNSGGNITARIAFFFILFAAFLLDWNDIWREYFPTWLQRFTWDHCYVKYKKCLYYLSFPKGVEWPVLLTYDEKFDRSYFEKTRFEIHETELSTKDEIFAERRRRMHDMKEKRTGNS